MEHGLTKEQLAKLVEWKLQNHPNANQGAIGGRYTYSYTPTSLGVVTVVHDALTNKSIDLTDYAEW